MNKIKATLACMALAVVCMSIYAIKDLSIFSNRKVGPQPDGSILVPSNQLLRPAGLQILIPGRPVDMALTPDEKLLIVKNKDGLDLIRISDQKIIQTLPYYKHGASSFTGICMSGDGHRVYTANSGDRIYIAQMEADSMHWEMPILLPKPSIGGDPAPGGLALNDAGDKIYVTLSRNNSLAMMDLKDTTRKIEIPVGISPYDIVIAHSNKAYVSNWGGRRPREGETTYNTSGSQVLVNPKTGVANNGSVSVIDLDRNISLKSIAGITSVRNGAKPRA